MTDPKMPITRREFVKVAVLGVGACYGAAIGYPVYRYLTSPAEKEAGMSTVTEVTLKDAENLPKGSVLMFSFGSRPSLLIHHEDGNWVAMDAVCTHLGCTVEYLPVRNVIHCNCHGGEYDAQTGKNISGPPPRPLTLYVAKVVPGGVAVSRT